VSGIAALLAPEGAPVDRALLERMTGALAFRAPDGGAIWAQERAGLGHALLRTAPAERPGPETVDGRCWIAADARIDARAELLPALRAAGERVEADASDAALILHAYYAWGTASPARLLGDFAFVLWDANRQRLFAARDRFGVKLLYHARAGGTLVLGNTLDVVRLHPELPDTADDLAVADYLLFGTIRDPEATSFAAVRALPPAHALAVEAGRVSTWRYWEAPLDGEIRFRRTMDYVERFREVFGAAVADRSREGRAGVMMSGGRDSTAIAAAAVEQGRAPGLAAFTMVYERLMPDREGEFAMIAAETLGIPLQLHPVDDYRVLGRWDDPLLRRPEPTDATPLAAGESDFNFRMLAHAPVALTGQGADAVLAESRSRLATLVAAGRPARALQEAAEYAFRHRRLPRPGVRSLLRRRHGAEWRPPYPEWMAPELEARLGLRERWRTHLRTAPSNHPLRPEAHGRISNPSWARLLEQYDPGVSRVPVEVRHPFFDVRVVEYLLAIPPQQWYNDKGLLRIAYGNRFPARFRGRGKTPLAAGSLQARLDAFGASDVARTRLAPGIHRWVDAARLPRFAGGRFDGGSFSEAWLHLRPINLSLWLERLSWNRP
jgi:asparagine synthase (glutamine-hydrolysing)